MGMLQNTSSYTRTQIDSVSYVPFLLHRITHSIPSQLSGVANGAEYLHSLNIVHGNLKPVSRPGDVLPNPLTTLGEHTH